MPAIALALAAVGLLGCGSGQSGPLTTTTALSHATANHLAKLSDEVASDLDAGETCTAAHAADDLASAVQDAQLPDSIRSGVSAAAGRLVDQVNCPAPPPAPPEKPPKPEKKPPKPQDHGDSGHVPPGHAKHGGLGPPGHAKLGGEPE
jgi:hypothetical protein